MHALILVKYVPAVADHNETGTITLNTLPTHP